MTLTLWDIMLPGRRARPAEPARAPAGRAGVVADRAGARAGDAPVVVRAGGGGRGGVRAGGRAGGRGASSKPAPGSAQERYEIMTRTMLARYGVRVRKWRTGMSGVAWEVTYRDGTVTRLIEAPRPRGPMSAAVFLHEIGHHAIGFHTYSPRCLEEYHAWKYAIDQMGAWELNITQRVHDRMHDSLHYAVEKARRRGIKVLPEELAPYVRARPRAARSVQSRG